MGEPQYQRLHSNNIGKTGSKLGDGFQKHLQDLERMNKLMTQSHSLTVSTFQIILACENIRFSSLFAAGDVSRGGTSATQRQKLHTDDAINVYIINRVVMGFQIQICTILRVFWSILVNFCVHLPTSSSKTQRLLLEKSIFHKYWLFCQRFFTFTFDLGGLLSFVCLS